MDMNFNIDKLVVIAEEAIALLKSDIASGENMINEDSIYYFNDALKSMKDARDFLKENDVESDKVQKLDRLIFELGHIMGVRYGL